MSIPQVYTEIANLALSHIGSTKDIQTLGDDNSEEDHACTKWFDTARRATFKRIPWNFACKQVVPALIVNNPTPEYLYAYTYPSDCLKVVRFMSWRLENDTERSRVPYRVMQPAPINLSQAIPTPTPPYPASGLWLYTNWPGEIVNNLPIMMEYVFDNTNVSQWPDSFNIALSYKLAELIVASLTSQDPQNKKVNLQNDFKMAIAQAMDENVNEDQRSPLPEAEVVRTRMGLDGWGYPGRRWIATPAGFDVQ